MEEWLIYSWHIYYPSFISNVTCLVWKIIIKHFFSSIRIKQEHNILLLVPSQRTMNNFIIKTTRSLYILIEICIFLDMTNKINYLQFGGKSDKIIYFLLPKYIISHTQKQVCGTRYTIHTLIKFLYNTWWSGIKGDLYYY